MAGADLCCYSGHGDTPPTPAERDAYIREHELPFHPLVPRGYSSIGCTHCTVPGSGRSGRWVGKPKTECGLHL